MKFGNIFNAVKSKVTLDAGISQVVAGTESRNHVTQSDALSKLNAVQGDIEVALTSALIDENTGDVTGELGEENVKAAIEVAKYALNPVQSVEKLANKSFNPEQGDKVFGNGTISLDTVDKDAVVAAVEAFKNVDVAASMYFSVSYQAMALKQDPVAELFYPIIVVSPDEAAIKIDVTTTSIILPSKRDSSGKPLKNYKKSIIKELNNTKLFTTDANRIYPVVRDESADRLFNPAGVTGIAQEVTVGDGYTVTTAPIKVNTEVDLIDISSTDELLSKGVIDETDMLNKFLGIDKLYFSLTGADGDNTVTEYYERDISTLPAKFIETPNGSVLDLQLSYANNSIIFTGGKFIKTDGSTTAIDDLESVPNGHYVKISLRLKGDANVETRSFEVNPTKLEFNGVFDASGNPLPETSDEYTKVKGVFDTVKLEGVLPEAYAANDNTRFKAVKLTSDTARYVYTMQRRHVVEEIVPINGDGDADIKNSTLLFITENLSKNGLNELVTAAGVISNLAVDTEDFGMASEFFRRAFYQDTIDVSTIVDGRESNKRSSDIENALKLMLKSVATKLYIESNYSKVFKVVNNGEVVKPTVIIGTDLTIGSYINDFSDDMFNYVVARSDEAILNGSLYMSFGVNGKERNTKPSLLNFGFCGWSPEVTLASLNTSGGRSVYETLHMPVYRHQTVLPILAVLNIHGFESVVGKLAVDTHAV